MINRVCGVDEAGRGPLAGPVCAAAVILPDQYLLAGLADSKKVSEKRREALAGEIKLQAVAFSIAWASVEEIDRLNILQATMLAMRRAIEGLQPAATTALIDGNRLPEISIPARAIIRGDVSEPCISAASILAKTERDALMRDLHMAYPQYGFDRHKGYDTLAHRHALMKYGPISAHRRSFSTVARVMPAKSEVRSHG